MAPRDGPDTRAVIICLRPCLHHFCHFKLSMACGPPTAPPHTILSIPYPEGAPHPLIFAHCSRSHPVGLLVLLMPSLCASFHLCLLLPFASSLPTCPFFPRLPETTH